MFKNQRKEFTEKIYMKTAWASDFENKHISFHWEILSPYRFFFFQTEFMFVNIKTFENDCFY